ncbi:hypothetical protein ACIHDR_08455 [Nocardia sp. NPDC052278]|uniref:hypothetical protein n=1 Tax=unclassified Nocardia TaxID=2637762 RepID=UPI00367D2225
MSRSLWADLQVLRARGTAFEEIGDEVQQVMQRLDAVLSEEGQWWGDDEAGAAFEKTYQPDARQAIAALRDIARALRGFGGQVTGVAGSLEAADQATGDSVTAAAAEPVPRVSEDQMVPDADQKSAAAAPRESPAGTPRESAAGAPRESAAAAPRPIAADSGSAPSARGVRAHTEPNAHEAAGGQEGVRPSGTDPSVGAGPQPDSPDSAAGVGRDEGGGGQRWPEPANASARGVPDAGRIVRPDAPTTVPPAREPLPRAAVPSGSTGTGPPAVSAPGDRKPSATPWQGSGNPPGRSSPVAGPARARDGKPTPDKKSATVRPHSPGERPAVVAGPAARPGNAIARLARALAERHGVEVSGFEATDLDATVVAEFLAATDDVLTRHRVIDVRAIAIAAVAEGGVVCVGRTEAGDADSWSVTLDGASAADPRRLDEILRDRRRPGAAVAQADTRPVYAATVREFGRAFDLAGGGQSRRRAQRILIEEYLRGDRGYRDAGLARVVAGYKRWRDQLSGASFDKGRFDAGEALADAFTDVMLNGDKATEPAKTLCGLLTDTAAARGGMREP